MDQSAIIAAAGLRSRTEAMDMLSNNLANTNSAGYKLDREFYGLFISEDASTPDDGPQASLPMVQKLWTDFRQGEIQPTGNPLDLAINGKGFFSVNGSTGPLYTRNGAFKLSSTGMLTTLDGYAVRGMGGAAIQAMSQDPIAISPDGRVQQAGQILGQIELVDFPDTTKLEKAGGTYFKVSDPLVLPAAVTDPTIEQGRIEASNVVASEAAVRMVELMRQYEMLQKAILVSADMNKKATEDVARVGS